MACCCGKYGWTRVGRGILYGVLLVNLVLIAVFVAFFVVASIPTPVRSDFIDSIDWALDETGKNMSALLLLANRYDLPAVAAEVQRLQSQLGGVNDTVGEALDVAGALSDGCVIGGILGSVLIGMLALLSFFLAQRWMRVGWTLFALVLLLCCGAAASALLVNAFALHDAIQATPAARAEHCPTNETFAGVQSELAAAIAAAKQRLQQDPDPSEREHLEQEIQDAEQGQQIVLGFVDCSAAYSLVAVGYAAIDSRGLPLMLGAVVCMCVLMALQTVGVVVAALFGVAVRPVPVAEEVVYYGTINDGTKQPPKEFTPLLQTQK